MTLDCKNMKNNPINCKYISPNELMAQDKEQRLSTSAQDVVSNEKHPEAFFPFLEQAPSGMYLGVGGAQNYLFLEHAPATRAILCDLAVPMMAAHHHAKSQSVVEESLTPAEQEWLKMSNGPVLERLSDPFPRIDHLLTQRSRSLYQHGRIDLWCADIFSATTVRKITEQVQQHKEKVSMMYFSNALNNPFYPSCDFTAQSLELLSDTRYFDPEGIVLQTLGPVPGYSFPDEVHHWHYSCLSIRKFCELMQGENRFSSDLLPFMEKKAVSYFR